MNPARNTSGLPNLWSLGALLLVFPIAAPVRAQADLPVVRANSPAVDVRDGDRLLRGQWTISPTVPLDIYVPRRSDDPVTVTFVTDVESQSFHVKPGEKIDFVFLLNGQHSCRTEIWMKERPARRAPGTPPGPVEIPFKLMGGKPHVEGRINGSSTLWLLFDTGAATTVLYPSSLDKGVAPRFDGALLNAGTGGTVERQTASDNRIAVGGLVWEHESAIYVEKQHDAGDGIIGINLFDGKVVEIDYDRMVVVIHDSLPEHAASFASMPITFDGSLPTVEGAFGTGADRIVASMVIDTGGTGALMGNDSLARSASSHGGYEIVGTARSAGVGPRTIVMDVVLVPEFIFAGHTFHGIPMLVPSREQHADVPSVDRAGPRGTLCLDVLGKFNTLLDLKGDRAYFKANTRIDEPIRARVGGIPVGVRVAVPVVALSVVGYAVLRFQRRSHRRADVGRGNPDVLAGP